MTEENLTGPALEAIPQTIQNALCSTTRPTSVVLSDDFNRHHPAWGGNQTHVRFTEQADELINFSVPVSGSLEDNESRNTRRPGNN